MAGTHPDAETEARDGTIDDADTGTGTGTGTDADVEQSEDASAGSLRSLLTTVKEVFRPVIRGWMVVVRAFSWLLARVVALAMFVFAFVPYGLVMRIVGFDPLRRSFDEDADSYWSETESTNRDMESFRKQY